jgi:hypothetical protein
MDSIQREVEEILPYFGIAMTDTSKEACIKMETNVGIERSRKLLAEALRSGRLIIPRRERAEEVAKELKETLKPLFCYYNYEPDKSKWLHPRAVCVPMIFEETIDKWVSKNILSLQQRDGGR